MTGRTHHYKVTTVWTGNTGNGTSDYKSYSRNYTLSARDKPIIAGSADTAFRGDDDRWNPEDLMVASISSCHKLWYLHMAATHGVIVTDYEDQAEGTMTQSEDGGGQFTQVILSPRVTITDHTKRDVALSLHHKAHELCFIARSVNFEIKLKPEIIVL